MQENVATITQGLTNIYKEIRVNSLVSQIRVFSWHSGPVIKKWAKELQQANSLLRSDSSMRDYALEQDSPAKFFLRLLITTPQITWDDVLVQFSARYKDLEDPQLAWQSLRQMKQHCGESFYERIGEIMQDAVTLKTLKIKFWSSSWLIFYRWFEKEKFRTILSKKGS